MSFFCNRSAQEQEVEFEPLSCGSGPHTHPLPAPSPRLQFTALGDEDAGQYLPLREFSDSEFLLKIRTYGFHL